MPLTSRMLVKLRPHASLAAPNPRANLRPLFDSAEPGPAIAPGIAPAPAWFLADIEPAETPWDAVHRQLSTKPGISADAIRFAEPDLPQSWAGAAKPDSAKPRPQYNDRRPAGPGFAWHLGDRYSQLSSARAAVKFDGVRTRIAHIDTGYDPHHLACPGRILHALEHNFVDADGNPASAADPAPGGPFDTSGHGTGTIGLLAAPAYGGAPEADILPLRIANSVVLFFTSGFARAIRYAMQQQCDVVSISMGGLPSRVWREAVDAAYRNGICIVAAAGDCFGGLPTHHVVYPARYRRVLAACGVMANGLPYYNLPAGIIEGSFGPPSAMTEALAAWAPNTPWARCSSGDIVDMDGAGTSSATPQIAAAAALWFEKHKPDLPRDWRRVEAVRHALFNSARAEDPDHFGRGILQARAALEIGPRLDLPKCPQDHDSFAFFRVITGLGLGLDANSVRERMLHLELAQRYMRNKDLVEAIPHPDDTPDLPSVRRFLDALIGDPDASQTLRRAAEGCYPGRFGPAGDTSPGAIRRPQPDAVIPEPAVRRLRAYTLDPGFSGNLATTAINQTTVEIPWEPLQPGPVGEYIRVVDPAYAPVDLNDPRLLATDGHAPAEGNPQFHQQSVYATAMTTICHFEAATGRPVQWRNNVPQLAIHPHAFRGENAGYDPESVALRFGYFEASTTEPGDHVPGSTVYTCMSQDIVAHETAHAILDGVHGEYLDATHPDTAAFHEGFSDLVALLQRFTNHRLIEDQITRSRGDLGSETLLGSLATQFGHTTGKCGALREAIGARDESGVWRRYAADPRAYRNTTDPHRRGALLVAAVFDALLAIYQRRTADLFRICSGGAGVAESAAIHPDLVRRLALEAARVARHILRICIRALDYVPPVNLTFGEYLRGIVTADYDLMPSDEYGYRVAFVEAFRRRGIYPEGVDTLSEERLLWEGTDIPETPVTRALVTRLKKFAEDAAYNRNRAAQNRRNVTTRAAIKTLLLKAPELAPKIGIEAALDFNVSELRCAHRTAIVAVTQRRGKQRGGSTLIVDLSGPRLKYSIRKRIGREGSSIA